MADTITQALSYLCHQYPCQTVLLYGSFATETQHNHSDIDVLVFADIAEQTHDASMINGHVLDAWIVPLAMLDTLDNYLHILPFKALKDDLLIAGQLEEKIIAARKLPSMAELAQLKAWLEKMLHRAECNSIEGNYRYHWLLHDLPELYCQFNREYYAGPVKTLSKIKTTDSELYAAIELLLGGPKNTALLRQTYQKIMADEQPASAGSA